MKPLDVSKATLEDLRARYKGTEVADEVFSFDEFSCPMRAVEPPPWPTPSLVFYLKMGYGSQ